LINSFAYPLLPFTEANPARKQTSLLLTFIMSTESNSAEQNSANIIIEKTESGRGLWVSGETLPFKDQLKQLGGKWNSPRKSWVFSLQKKHQVLALFNLPEEAIGQAKPTEKVETPKPSSTTEITIEKTDSGKGLWIGGETKPYKDQLKELGAKWNSPRKSWVFPLKRKDELLELFSDHENLILKFE
jgi:hypothetical protein